MIFNKKHVRYLIYVVNNLYLCTNADKNQGHSIALLEV